MSISDRRVRFRVISVCPGLPSLISSMSKFVITRQSPYPPLLLGSECFHWL